jgi:hypothetical protein
MFVCVSVYVAEQNIYLITKLEDAEKQQKMNNISFVSRVCSSAGEEARSLILAIYLFCVWSLEFKKNILSTSVIDIMQYYY